MAVSIDRAIATFAHGFAFTRSFTHPCRADRLGSLWVVRDAYRKNGEYRNEEWIAHGTDPIEVDRIARANTRGRFAVCAIHGNNEPDEPLRSGYKAMGYRLRGTEPLMVHELKRIPRFKSPARIARVEDEVMAAKLAKAAGARQVLPEHLGRGTPLRQYVATIGQTLVGWVRSIDVGSTTWCSNMFVLPKFRRQGIARSMLSRMLSDDRENGSKQAILLASHTGAMLYPFVGYRQIGTLLLFTPRRPNHGVTTAYTPTTSAT